MFTPPSQYSVNKRTTSCFPAEVCRIFAPYAGRTPGNRNRCTTTARRRSSYTRSYFCLDNTDQMVVPTRGEKETLNAAGLGEQRLTFLGNYCVFHVVWPLWTCFWGTYIFVSSVTITYNSNDGIKKNVDVICSKFFLQVMKTVQRSSNVTFWQPTPNSMTVGGLRF